MITDLTSLPLALTTDELTSKIQVVTNGVIRAFITSIFLRNKSRCRNS